MKRLPLITGIIYLTFHLNAQDLGKYFDYSRFIGEDLHEYEEVNFTWNMKGNVQVVFNEGLNFLREGQIGASLIHLDSVIKMDSSLWMVYYYRGIAWHQLDKLKEAKKDLKASLKLNAKVAEIHAKLGDLYLQSNDLNSAENYYQASVEVNPSFAKGYYKLGNTNIYQGQPRKAERHYEKATEVNPNFGNAYTALGIMKFRVKKDDNVAFEYFNKAIDVDKNNSLAYFWRGLANSSLEKPDQTLVDWNKVVELSPTNLFYLNMRGYLNFELKKYEDAFRDFRKIVLGQSIDENNYKYNQTMLDKKIDIQFAIRYMIRNSYGLPEEALLSVQKACCFLLTGNEKVALTDLNKAQKIEKASSIFFLKAVTFENLKKTRFSSFLLQ